MVVQDASGRIQRVDNEERLPLDGLPTNSRVLRLRDFERGLEPRQVVHLSHVSQGRPVDDVSERARQDRLLHARRPVDVGGGHERHAGMKK